MAGRPGSRNTPATSSVLREMSPPFDVFEHDIQSSVSIGVAMVPRDGTAMDEIVKKANAACYRSKAVGRGIFRFYNNGTAEAAETHASAGAQHFVASSSIVNPSSNAPS